MRRIQLTSTAGVVSCPKCENNTEFDVHSLQISEDCCEVWVTCPCGFDPTANDGSLRYENTWGGTHDDNIVIALDCWTEAILCGNVQ